MKSYRLYKEQFVKRPLEEVFEFFKAPENLSRITPKNLSFNILTPSPVPMRQGQLIDYQIRLFGMPARWTSKITEYKPPHFFVDEQLRGPYAYWKHSHFFEEAQGGTLIKDEVLYRIPMGPLGQLANYIFVRRDLENIFSYREKVIREIFP